MEYTTLPGTDVKVSPICLGTWQFNNGSLSNDKTFPPQDSQTSKEITDTAIQCGINFFDTAEGYTNSECVLGELLEGRRQDVVIASKFGGRVQQYTGEDVEVSVMNSLKNLRTTYIDLYQVHWPSMVCDMTSCVEELKRQQALGHIRHYGVSNFGPGNLTEFLKAGGTPVTNQENITFIFATSRLGFSDVADVPTLENSRLAVDLHDLSYNMLWRSVEYDIIPLCMEKNIGVLAYSALGQGLLTGKYKSVDDVPEGRRRARLFNAKSSTLSRHEGEGAEKQLFQTLDSIRKVCDKADISMGTMSLNWLLHQNMVKSVIMGASSSDQVKQNIKLVTLQKELLEELNEATQELKDFFGSNADMWAKESRMK